MATKKSVKTVNLKAAQDENVLLTISIGNAQIGGSVVRFKNSSVIIGKGEIKNLKLGMSGELSGRTLKVTTNILDINEQTNGIVVTYFFNACTPAATVFHDTVDNDGDVFSYQVEFNFN